LDDRERTRVEKDLYRRLRQRYQDQARFYVLVTTSLMISGSVTRGVVATMRGERERSHAEIAASVE